MLSDRVILSHFFWGIGSSFSGNFFQKYERKRHFVRDKVKRQVYTFALFGGGGVTFFVSLNFVVLGYSNKQIKVYESYIGSKCG